MRLTILNQEFSLDSQKISAIDTIELIREKTKNSTLIFSHLRIDGVDVFHEHIEYLTANLAEIVHIEVIMVKVEELITDMLESAHQYVQGAIPAIKALSDEFYKSGSDQVWVKLEQLVEGIQFCQETSQFIKQQNAKESHSQYEVLLDFTNEVEVLMEAVQQQDAILIGDILQYEILPKFEQVSAGLPQINANEVVSNDLN
ncbi:hypothetical protein [Brevibacillus centrosporus]|uniref:hypothetical protein n=1 Tax=Brevibacillus centrosporus TaxID=54910 RepID=UPI003987133F